MLAEDGFEGAIAEVFFFTGFRLTRAIATANQKLACATRFIYETSMSMPEQNSPATPQAILPPDFLKKLCQKYGFQQAGWIPLQASDYLPQYQSWLAQSYHGEMEYLSEHLPFKSNPQGLLENSKSVFVFSHSYVPHPAGPSPFPNNQIALYAQGKDYHIWIKEKLAACAEELKEIFPNEQFLIATDSAPLMERDLARKAGLGWVGKNTCLIHPKHGSLFLLGEIITTLAKGDDELVAPLSDFCGTCSRCIDACPTKALVEPRKLDARKCISYLTIESKTIPDEKYRSQMGSWLFGCDICQTVCPWNQKNFDLKRLAPRARESTSKILLQGSVNVSAQGSPNGSQNDTAALIDELRFLLTSSGKKILKQVAGTALHRAGHMGLRRNALVVIANAKLVELKSEVEDYLQHPRLGKLALWVLQKLG